MDEGLSPLLSKLSALTSPVFNYISSPYSADSKISDDASSSSIISSVQEEELANAHHPYNIGSDHSYSCGEDDRQDAIASHESETAFKFQWISSGISDRTTCLPSTASSRLCHSILLTPPTTCCAPEGFLSAGRRLDKDIDASDVDVSGNNSFPFPLKFSQCAYATTTEHQPPQQHYLFTTTFFASSEDSSFRENNNDKKQQRRRSSSSSSSITSSSFEIGTSSGRGGGKNTTSDLGNDHVNLIHRKTTSALIATPSVRTTRRNLITTKNHVEEIKEKKRRSTRRKRCKQKQSKENSLITPTTLSPSAMEKNSSSSSSTAAATTVVFHHRRSGQHDRNLFNGWLWRKCQEVLLWENNGGGTLIPPTAAAATTTCSTPIKQNRKKSGRGNHISSTCAENRKNVSSSTTSAALDSHQVEYRGFLGLGFIDRPTSPAVTAVLNSLRRTDRPFLVFSLFSIIGTLRDQDVNKTSPKCGGNINGKFFVHTFIRPISRICPSSWYPVMSPQLDVEGDIILEESGENYRKKRAARYVDDYVQVHGEGGNNNVTESITTLATATTNMSSSSPYSSATSSEKVKNTKERRCYAKLVNTPSAEDPTSNNEPIIVVTDLADASTTTPPPSPVIKSFYHCASCCCASACRCDSSTISSDDEEQRGEQEQNSFQRIIIAQQTKIMKPFRRPQFVPLLDLSRILAARSRQPKLLIRPIGRVCNSCQGLPLVRSSSSKKHVEELASLEKTEDDFFLPTLNETVVDLLSSRSDWSEESAALRCF